MKVGLYDIFFSKKNGLPELRKIKTLNALNDISYSTNDIVNLLNSELGFSEMRNEHTYIACLSFANFLMGVGILGIGDNEEVKISNATLGAYLLLMGADRFTVFHNHPAGTIEPSESDEQTSLIYKGIGAIYNIELYDDVVVAREGWYGLLSKSCNYN